MVFRVGVGLGLGVHDHLVGFGTDAEGPVITSKFLPVQFRQGITLLLTVKLHLEGIAEFHDVKPGGGDFFRRLPQVLDRENFVQELIPRSPPPGGLCRAEALNPLPLNSPGNGENCHWATL